MLYDRAELYRLAFSWDLSREIAFYNDVFFGSPFPVRQLLEPACGGGRYFPGLEKAGFSVLGYDLSSSMLADAHALILDSGLNNCEALPGSMQDFLIDRQFDGALNPVNSFRYLTEDEHVISHLKNTARMLKPGAIYILEFCYGFLDPQSTYDRTWNVKTDKGPLTASWTVLNEDPLTRISLEKSSIRCNGQEFTDLHHVRLWTHEDFQSVLHQVPEFSLQAVYDEDRFPIVSPRLFGEMGNLCHILQRL